MKIDFFEVNVCDKVMHKSISSGWPIEKLKWHRGFW